MKKVKLKLGRHEMESLMRMLEYVLQNPAQFDYSDEFQDKLILALLGELYEKIRVKFSPFQKDYRLTITTAHSLALLIHALLPIGTLPSGTEVDINGIIAIVHKQQVKL